MTFLLLLAVLIPVDVGTVSIRPPGYAGAALQAKMRAAADNHGENENRTAKPGCVAQVQTILFIYILIGTIAHFYR